MALQRSSVHTATLRWNSRHENLLAPHPVFTVATMRTLPCCVTTAMFPHWCSLFVCIFANSRMFFGDHSLPSSDHMPCRPKNVQPGHRNIDPHDNHTHSLAAIFCSSPQSSCPRFMNALGHDDTFPSGLHFFWWRSTVPAHLCSGTSLLDGSLGDEIHLLRFWPSPQCLRRSCVRQWKNTASFSLGVQSPRHFHPRVEMLGACARRRAIWSVACHAFCRRLSGFHVRLSSQNSHSSVVFIDHTKFSFNSSCRSNDLTISETWSWILNIQCHGHV